MNDLPSRAPATKAVPELLFFTYADARYDIFAVPYVYFALTSNPDAFVEIILGDFERFSARHAGGIARLRALFGDRFLFRQSSTVRSGRAATPGVIRFVEQPRTEAVNVYIGDIDLLVMEDVLATHRRLMQDHGLPFSNVIRPGSAEKGAPRLSGLHFCAYDLIYPLPDLSDLDLGVLNDEHVLHTIMSRRGSMVPEDFSIRPQCGIHMSLSRDPLGRSRGPWYADFSPEPTAGWSGREYDADVSRLLDDERFRLMYFDFDYEFRLLFAAFEARARGADRSLHRIASSYLVDRRFSDDWSSLTRHELETLRDGAVRDGRPTDADRVSARVARLWPLRWQSWRDRAVSAFADGNDRAAIEALEHALELSSGSARDELMVIASDRRERMRGSDEGRRLLGRIDGIAAAA